MTQIMWASVICMAFVTVGTVITVCSAAEAASTDLQRLVVCYFESWAHGRHGNGKFDVEDIDTELCTHLLYAFAGVDNVTHTIISLYPTNDLDTGNGAYRRFTDLKMKKPGLKTMLSVGGSGEGSVKFSQMAASAATRKTFINSVLAWLEKFGFDGLDIDWEYPGQKGGVPEDKANYAHLIQELQTAFAPKSYLLTAAVPAGRTNIVTGYDIPALQRHLDFANVMAYNYHGQWQPFTGHIAPLFASHLDVEHGHGYELYNVNATVQLYLSGGMDPGKIVVGMPLRGNGFTLQNSSQHGLYAPTLGPMPECEYTRSAGSCSYGELCALEFTKPGWTHTRDEEQHSTYSFTDEVWIGYDDPQAVREKSDLIRRLGLAGGMVWALDLDDTQGACGEKFPLLTELWRQMRGEVSPGVE